MRDIMALAVALTALTQAACGGSEKTPDSAQVTAGQAADSGKQPPPVRRTKTPEQLPPRLLKHSWEMTNRDLEDALTAAARVPNFIATAEAADPQRNDDGNRIRLTLRPEEWSWNFNPDPTDGDWSVGTGEGFILAQFENKSRSHPDVVLGLPAGKQAIWVVEKNGSGIVVASLLVRDPSARPELPVRTLSPHRPGNVGALIRHMHCLHEVGDPIYEAAKAEFRRWERYCKQSPRPPGPPGPPAPAGPRDSSGAGHADGSRSALSAQEPAMKGHPKLVPVALAAWVSCDLGCCTLGP